MKKVLLVLIMTISSYGFSQEKDDLKWYLSTEANTSFYTVVSDITFSLSDKMYLSNWSTYATEGQLESEGSYGLSLSMLNYKPKEFFIVSIGHRAFENYTFKEKTSYIVLRFTYKVL